MMKKYVLPTVLLLSFFNFKALAGDVDFTGYFRAPLGSNLMGGKQIPINNSGSFGNEFRLGNEQGYGELNFTSHILKAKGDSPTMVEALFTIAINPPGDVQYNDYGSSSGNMQIVQAYLMGRFDSDALYWMGKRFNRWGYAPMDDFFYFADMSGNGAGVEQIKTSNGELAFSVLQFVDTTVSGTTGTPAKTAIEARWKGVRISENEKNNLDFWLAGASTGAGSGTRNGTTAIDYDDGKGGALGIRWNSPFMGGNNELSVQIGTSVMQSLRLDQDAVNVDDSLTGQVRTRFVENYDRDLDPNWTLRSTLVYDVLRLDQTNQIRWTSVGFRPTYQMNDHLQLMVELGFSSIMNDAEKTEKPRELTRVTVGPQWGYGKGLAANQVFRVTLSHSMWNEENADLANVRSINAANAFLKDKKEVTQLGVEAEMGF